VERVSRKNRGCLQVRRALGDQGESCGGNKTQYWGKKKGLTHGSPTADRSLSKFSGQKPRPGNRSRIKEEPTIYDNSGRPVKKDTHVSGTQRETSKEVL